MILRENTVIKPGIGESPIKRPYRVLLLDCRAGIASIIEIAGLRSEGGKRRKYARGPKLFDLSTLENALKEGQIVETRYQAPGHWSMLDQEYVDLSPTTKERERRERRLAQRDANLALLEPIVKGMSVREIARNPTALRASIIRQAKAKKKDQTTIYRILNLYLASGGVRNSLIPDTHRRGGPGVEKAQRRKLGRKSRLEKAGKVVEESYYLKEEDKKKLAIGYLLTSKTINEADAYRLTCGVHWSTLKGDGTPEIFPPHQRPTRAQFRYWGRKLNQLEDRKRRIGLGRLAIQATPGSTQDQVCAVGQMAMLDSTTNDAYLTSMFSRLKKLPPMHITILKEVRSTVVIGFYVGWESPSTWTAHQAILCGAESKVEICARFGITMTDEDWPSLLCKLILADNGELKSKTTTAAEEEFHFAVEYTKSWSGQSKSDVETQHHTHHKELNHKLPGTTLGKRRERGEKHPALEAIWNYAEYMHEFLLMVIEYNNEEVAHLAPTAMLTEGVRPTRINILKWMMEKNMRADLPYDLERLRAFTMPPAKAVMTKRGIRLLMPDGRRHVPDVRFYAPALQSSPQFKEAVIKDSAVNITIRQSETDTSHVWFSLPDHGLTSIPNVSSDVEMKEKGTVVDFVQWVEERDLVQDMQRGDEDQQALNKLLRRQATTNRGKAELTKELAMQEKPSQKSMVGGLRKNRDEEIRAIKSGGGPSAIAEEEAPLTATVEAADERGDAASEAMESFMKEFAA
ncbi:hypothetical protein [Lysobacter solisilvae (ex Woo and Kim 2020)]|uniref:Integrase catalytic domain-containing protein n=1 Tax=Agrilutibacter terrestris TaxID=2865112 RepID=A0A7H0FZZ4_9GAMM|nr:hypothetical protein [Lysobacter terrestris]QNP41610.1 hypothetical protein H8B22_05230 [Lysobacter terrestris]